MTETASSEPSRKKIRFDPNILDVKFLMETSDGDMEFLTQLIELFKETTVENLESLRLALEQSNQHDAIHFSHDIKGSSANLGAQLARVHAAEMERLSRDGQLEDCAKMMPELKRRLDTIFKALDDFLADPAAAVAAASDPEAKEGPTNAKQPEAPKKETAAEPKKETAEAPKEATAAAPKKETAEAPTETAAEAADPPGKATTEAADPPKDAKRASSPKRALDAQTADCPSEKRRKAEEEPESARASASR
eukprot:TRINITY_DN5705_c0_g1_i2.p2 TRINITY_DN5705_c0_g1~~TRINITY_DN5705_c0_g1_i2.p2  ORF type:complete len:251 (+),score=64.24 TRINITY_DN5705_c0_g1_i2:85-837(+)